MKTCTKGGVTKELTEFYDRGGQCKECVRARVRKHREANPEKYKARTAVNNALRDGRLTKEACPCGESEVEAHHTNYSKPLDVQWLCTECHNGLNVS